MCFTFKEETCERIFRLVVPFVNRLANLRLADWLANLQIGQMGRLVGTYNVYIYLDILRLILVSELTSGLMINDRIVNVNETSY